MVLFSAKVRTNTQLNARRILGDSASPRDRTLYGQRVVASFYDFVYDVGLSQRVTRRQLEARISSVEGIEHYFAARALKRGAIVVTAHMGSFEVGMAALLAEEKVGRVHVVFKQDDVGGFESMRTALRQRLGVLEAPLDEGWTIWMRLRDALNADDVVLLQGDRCMPGQKGTSVRLLGGHVQLPTGPVKLAMATDAPIVPIYSLRNRDGSVRIIIDEPIHVTLGDDIEPPLRKIAASIERQLRAHPEQWLMLEKVFDEDRAATKDSD